VDDSRTWSTGGLTCRITGAAFRFFTGGRTLGQPGKASPIVIIDSDKPFAFLCPDPESVTVQHLPCHPSATDSAVEPLSSVDHSAVKVEPYFVRSTASASEILTNVAIQDMLAADDPGFCELSRHPRNASILSSVPGPLGLYDFDPLASSESSDSDFNESPRRSPEVSPDPSDRHEAASFRPVQINKMMRLISSTEVEVNFRITCHSPPGEDDDDDDDEEVIIIPVLARTSLSFPHPHLLSPIPEGDEDEEETTEKRTVSMLSIETVRFSSILACARPDTGLVRASDGVEHLCESSACVGSDRRTSV
jgi:hypothetical protein